MAQQLPQGGLQKYKSIAKIKQLKQQFSHLTSCKTNNTKN